MHTIRSRVTQLLRDSSEEVNGFVLENGVRVRFPSAKSNLILDVARAGSVVEIDALMSGGSDAQAIFIANIDSGKSASFHARTSPQCPEVYAYPSPGSATPLAPASSGSGAPAENSRQFSMSHATTVEIEKAYDGLHRSQAILSYLKMMNHELPAVIAVSQYLDEAKHTYVQALSLYEKKEFAGALEFAAASSNLSQLIEILISTKFYLRHPVSTPPESLILHSTPSDTQKELQRIKSCLMRIRWVIENGTLPLRDRAQAKKLSAWSETLQRSADRLIATGKLEEAVQFAQAAEAAACSAEHICKRWYVTRATVSSPVGTNG